MTSFLIDTIQNAPEALIDGIKTLYNCREVELRYDENTEQCGVAIADPQRFHWLDEDDLFRIERELQAGNI
jgi:hypothetical protein